jgi:adenylylsulfate kinase
MTWRVVASLYTGIVAFALTGTATLTAAIMGGEVLVKMILYFMHERVWSLIGWGTKAMDKGLVIWLTGLPSSGKTTLAESLVGPLAQAQVKTEILDGDVLRGLFPKTGFSKEERDNHILRVGFMASLLAKHGVVALCSFVSPYKETRDKVRKMCGDNFLEIFVDCPVDDCIKRDVKGLYAKALSGEIKQFTGIDDPYEAPDQPEAHLLTSEQTIEESVAAILETVTQKRPGLLPASETIDAYEP